MTKDYSKILSQGSVEKISTGEKIDNVVLQLVGVKDFNKKDVSHRLTLSDGVYQNDMFFLRKGTTMNDFPILSIIKLASYKTSMNPKVNRRLVNINEIVLLDEGSGKVIGNPIHYGKKGRDRKRNGSNQESNGISGSNENNAVSESAEMKPQTTENNIKVEKNISGCNQVNVAEPNPKKTKLMDSSKPKKFVDEIASVTPYQNNITLCARVTQKSSVRSFTNAKGPGKLFSFNVSDQSGEIRITCFTKETDKFFDVIETNKVYYISKVNVRTANKKFSNLKHDYELVISEKTEISLCEDDVETPAIPFNFIKISTFADKNPNDEVDVCAVVHQVGDVSDITTRAGKELTKRELSLVDDSNMMITCTLWGNDAQNFNHPVGTVLSIKGAKISDFNGRTCTISFNSSMFVDMKTSDVEQLSSWYISNGSSLDFGTFSSDNVRSSSDKIRTIEQLNNICEGDRTEYADVRASVVVIKEENFFYKSCPSSDCTRKVSEVENERYRCEKCDKEFDNYEYSYMLNMNIMDHTGNLWIRGFREAAEIIMNVKANVLGELNMEDDNEMSLFQEYFQKALHREYDLKIRLRMESYNDESKLNSTIVSIRAVDYKQAHANYVKILQAY